MTDPVSSSATRPEREPTQADPASSRAVPASGSARGSGWLKAIAVFRVVKAIVLIAVAAGAFSLMGQNVGEVAEAFVRRAGLHRESQVVQSILEKITGLTPSTLTAIGGGAIAYAVLFLVEAYGLFRGRTWAEWLTIVATTSFIPIEVIEIVRRVHAWKIAALVVNVVIVVYLVARRLRARHESEGDDHAGEEDRRARPEGQARGEIALDASR